jgi:hypothetical protein
MILALPPQQVRIYSGVACASSCDNPTSQLPVCTNNPLICPPGSGCVQSQLLGMPYEVCAAN